jgi:RHS repeat-associated protein
MTDANKKVVWQWQSDAYGYTPPDSDPDGDGVANTLDLRFPGQLADSETSLNYNLNRYYEASTGRYTQSDPIGLQGGNNTYAYVLDNPVSFSDPSGFVCHYEDYSGNLVKVCDGKGGTGDSADHGTGDNEAGMTSLVPADLDVRTIEEIEKDLHNKECHLVVYSATVVPCIYSKEAGKVGAKACSIGRKLLYKVVCDSKCEKPKPPSEENQ